MTGQVRAHDPAHVGVTSTRDGLVRAQSYAARQVLADLRAAGATDLHAGDCVGGDEELQLMAHELGFWVAGHPGPGLRYRAYGWCDEVRPVKPFDVRNQHIVDESGTLLACPPTEPDHELLRSGTWQTIRMGRRAGIRVIVIGPSGAVSDSARSAS